MDDSAIIFDHDFTPLGNLSACKRCWFLRRVSTATQLFTGLLTDLPFVKRPWICAIFASLFEKRVTLFSVSVPVYLKLERRCETLDNVCFFSGQAYRSWKGHFIHRAHRVRHAAFVARVLVYSFHAKNSWTNKHRWLGEITARGTDGVEVGCSAR